MLVVGLAIAILIGVSLGMLGGGGSILTVPLLLYVFGVEAKAAIAMSLLVVGTTSVAALVPHARAGRVQWKTGAIFGAASMIGAYGAGRVAKFIPSSALLLAFGAMMLVTAVAMMRPKRASSAESSAPKTLPLHWILLEGLAVGAVTGLVGAGGGFLVVPALALLAGLAMPEAVATSLMVIALKSFAGFAGYVSTVSINYSLAAQVIAAAIVGSFIGTSLVSRVHPDSLRKGFGWFIVVMSIFVLGQEIPKALGYRVTVVTHAPQLFAAMLTPLIIAAIVKKLRAPRASETPATHP
ncbi:MAG: sulfite exporter TauE/SafE family protein [Polyangiales bacterium]